MSLQAIDNREIKYTFDSKRGEKFLPDTKNGIRYEGANGARDSQNGRLQRMKEVGPRDVHDMLLSATTGRPQSRSTLSDVFQVPTPSQANLEGYTFLTLSLGLRIFYSTILALLISLMLWLTFSIKHRKVPSMQLSQPSVLAFFTMSSAVAIGGCYLLIPWSDWGCTFRQPVILTALSLSGSVLAGRVWRISTIMSPVLSLGGASSFGGEGRLGSLHASDSETTLGDGASEDMTRSRRRRRRKIQRRIVEMKKRY